MQSTLQKQCFAQLFPWYAGDSPMVCCWSGRIPRVVFETSLLVIANGCMLWGEFNLYTLNNTTTKN
jgi:hypothetical protein